MVSRMDGLFHGKAYSNEMIWGYPYFRKLPYIYTFCSGDFWRYKANLKKRFILSWTSWTLKFGPGWTWLKPHLYGKPIFLGLKASVPENQWMKITSLHRAKRPQQRFPWSFKRKVCSAQCSHITYRRGFHGFLWFMEPRESLNQRFNPARWRNWGKDMIKWITDTLWFHQTWQLEIHEKWRFQ